MLLDAPSMYFRAFFGVPDSSPASDGSPNNAVRGFLDFIARLVSTRRPTRMVAAMDYDWRPAFRVKAIPSYKAHRVANPVLNIEEVPDLLTPQIPVIEAVLDAIGIAHLGLEACEADDVLGTLATRADVPTEVVTGDRDLFQLVDDAAGVKVLYIAKGVGNLEVVTEAVVSAKYGIPGRAYADFAVLRGDPSDGLPGVKGVGDKTAASLITKYGSLEALLTTLADPRADVGARAKLEAAADYLAVAPTVVQVVRDAPVPDLDDRLPSAPRDAEALLELVDRWNLESPVNRVLNALASTD